MCGEKRPELSATKSTKGSSPRVRGKGKRNARFRDPVGIIPACAGKSPTIRLFRKVDLDHPRVCGEKFQPHNHRNARPGSSPRVRGKVGAALQEMMLGRIIPACAGKSPDLTRTKPRMWDHPRVCGEKTYFSDVFALFLTFLRICSSKFY